jgi:hypothetical protein
MANRPDALQSLRKSQCFSASVRMKWLYHPDAIQCLTRIRVSASRHSYGKTAATVRTMCDPVRTMSSIRQERAYQVQPSGRSSFIYGNCVHQFNRPDISLHGPDAPKPYYGNSVQPKCNRPDARATPSGHGLVMGAFSATLERRLQLTVRTLDQAVRTPYGILDITFYSNIGLGRNWRRWKADKKFCQLTIQPATKIVWTERFARPDGPAENSRITFRTRKTWPVRTALAPVRTRVFQTPFWMRFWVPKPINKRLEVCFQHRIRW